MMGCEEQPAEIDMVDDEAVIDGGPASDTDPLALMQPDGGLTTALDATMPSEQADGGRPLNPMYARVYDLLTEHCINCHGPMKTLDLSTPERAHQQLVGVNAQYKACVGDGGLSHVRVVAGSPQTSLLQAKLESRQTCGKPMPPDGLLTAEEIDVFADWIAAGAKLH
jgi:hypothetical protein